MNLSVIYISINIVIAWWFPKCFIKNKKWSLNLTYEKKKKKMKLRKKTTEPVLWGVTSKNYYKMQVLEEFCTIF